VGRRTITTSAEFRRIQALPFREWTPERIAEAQRLVTAEYRTHRGSMAALPIQAIGVIEAYNCGGLFAGVGVGHGKTLLGFLAMTAMEARRPILVVKADLYHKTLRDLRDLRQHWFINPRVEVITYEKLSQPDSVEFLAAMAPDLIVLDECQALKDITTARGIRFMKFMEQNQDVKLIAMSGSVTRKTLRDYWHFMCLCLKESAPMPYRWSELESWSLAIDSDVEDWRRPHPGVLLELAPIEAPPAADEWELARLSYQRRLRGTEGVVMTGEGAISTSLTLSERPAKLPPAISDALDTLRETWETPNGDELQQAVDIWRHARELACGFWYRWEPQPPKPWLAARKAWHKFVRGVIARGEHGLDSPFNVANRYADHPLHQAWVGIRDTYIPNSVPKWIDTWLLEDAARWLREGPGIAWVEHQTVGEQLARISGFPFYGGGERASREILDAKGPIIASIKAHGTGKNLQGYSRNLVLSCPPSGATWEQLLGRTHRLGQQADTVSVEVYLHVDELRAGFLQALKDARYIEQSTGQQQKLIYADKTMDWL
jgi:hypothetical protein